MTTSAGSLLVIDDNEMNRDMLSRRLRRHRYTVAVADSGTRALEMISRQEFALVLLDIEMPGMSGIEVLTTLRRQYSPLELPIIMVTAKQESQDLVEALSLGASDYVTKPVDLPICLARIQNQLARKQAEAALRESEERYTLAVRGANDGLWDWNVRTGEIYFSPRWKAMLGGEDGDIASTRDEWLRRVHVDDMGRVNAEITAHLEGRTSHFEVEHRMRHQDGTYRWMRSRGLAVRDAGGRAYRMSGSQTDITDGKVSDALTGLPNRLLFMDRLGRAIERGRRQSDHQFTVLFLDLDRFKLVNDSLGHMAGDQLLVAIARRLETCLRGSDSCARFAAEHTVARLGGDEFTILLEDVGDVSNAVRVADRIQTALQQPFDLDGHEVFTSASIGIATSTTGYDGPEAVLRDADTAMYRAKALGKARCEVFDTEMRDRAVARLRIENDLRRAIERDEFIVHYQPIVTLTDEQLNGFEALVRWRHPERGLVSPAEFIPVAEETGAILPIGWWVLREACRQMRVWQSAFGGGVPLTVSVNLSGKQFLQPDLIEQVERILTETGLPAASVKLEITESMIIESAEAVIGKLLHLKALGVQLAIDDFGTGYSSLSYLHRFPIDSLKIDRSFVNAMSGGRSEIVRAIVGLAHHLRLDVVAEGVGTSEQLAQLRAVGCQYGQGYYFSRPLDSQAAEELIRTTFGVPVALTPGNSGV